jgi:hypothetical protein
MDGLFLEINSGDFKMNGFADKTFPSHLQQLASLSV